MNTKMQTKKAKRGFTITELVIVIAVIAILAAVLIPTFSNVINRANESAAMQEAKSEYDNFSPEVILADAEDALGDDFLLAYKEGTDGAATEDTKYFVVIDGQFIAEKATVSGDDVTYKDGEGTKGDKVAETIYKVQNDNITIYKLTVGAGE